MFIIVDGSFFAANMAKVFQGGWVPLLLASIVYGVMWIWHRGAIAVQTRVDAELTPLSRSDRATAVRQDRARAGLGGLLHAAPRTETPPVMSWHVRHNRSLHEHVLALTMTVVSVPQGRHRRAFDR